jgi:hypothetical protein
VPGILENREIRGNPNTPGLTPELTGPKIYPRFQTRIVVPMNAPTASLNRYTIEFGYDKYVIEDRHMMGITNARMVRKNLVAYGWHMVGITNARMVRQPANQTIRYFSGSALKLKNGLTSKISDTESNV